MDAATRATSRVLPGNLVGSALTERLLLLNAAREVTSQTMETIGVLDGLMPSLVLCPLASFLDRQHSWRPHSLRRLTESLLAWMVD